jgi:hypothetical protein
VAPEWPKSPKPDTAATALFRHVAENKDFILRADRKYAADRKTHVLSIISR